MVIKKRFKYITYLVSFFFIITVFFLCQHINSLKNQNLSTCKKSSNIQTIDVNSNNNIQDDEMIGLWVPFLDLCINSSENTKEKFETKFQNIINKSKNNKINTLIVHVRSHGDALYPSEIFPWSHLLTGTQGADPGFDPLEYMIKTTHENGLKFHAWINPLRVKSKNSPENLSESNPYFKFSCKYFLNHTDGICYNPAYTETRKLIIDGVKEIVKKYDIDGIHFDDYFYPSIETLTTSDSAYEDYIKSQNKPLNIYDWRKENITVLIKEIYNEIKIINPNIQFGISPPGNIKKCYQAGADVNLWVSQENCIDYICPQIYWSPQFAEMPFEKTACEWKNIVKNKKINCYAGLALYKVGSDADNNTWKNQKNIISTEIQILKKLNYSGFILYSSTYLDLPNTQAELSNLQKEIMSRRI